MLSKDGMTGLGDDVNFKEYKRIADQTKLEFSEANKESFEIDEEVQFNLIVKNIQKLAVSIYEFNTETYYKKNLKPFDNSVNLDGLQASEQTEYTYDFSSNFQHRETFKFP